MNKTILTTLGALGLLAGAAWAFQFAGSTTRENVIAARLEGKWLINTDVTDRLDSGRQVTPPRSIEFVRNDRVVAQLRAESPRFQNDVIYMGGTMKINGSEDHWFVITNEYGNAHVVILTPTLRDPIGAIMPVNINLVCSRDLTRDMLFLGGDLARDSAAAYDRMGP
jgi:hypothetical protein